MKEHWTIGGAFRNYDLLVKFLNIVNYVEPEAVSFSVFDCPYGLTWEGGRSFIPFKGYDTTFFEKYQWFYDKKISFNFVFSNKFIETKDFDDPRGNAFLEYAHKDTNACIVSNDSFGAYIKNHYPKYKLIYSLTGTAARPSIDWYKEKLLIYDIVVVPTELAITPEFTDAFEDLSRFEVLVNDSCFPHCGFRKLHFELAAKGNYEHNPEIAQMSNSICYKHRERLNKLTKQQLLGLKDSALTISQIQSLRSIGFRNFKMSGRESESALYHDINRYLFPLLNINEVMWKLHALGLFGDGTVVNENNVKFDQAMQKYIKAPQETLLDGYRYDNIK